MSLYPASRTIYVRDRKNYSILKKPSWEQKNAAENLYVHCLSVLTCAGLVSERTSSKPAPESYLITSCISDDITKGLDQKATHRSLNNYDKSKYNAREFKPENLFSPT